MVGKAVGGSMKTSDQIRAMNARADRDQKIALKSVWNGNNRDKCNEYQRRYVEKKNQSFAAELLEQRKPIDCFEDAIMLTSDYHVPFMHWGLFEKLMDEAEFAGVEAIAIGGDLWDCDNYSRFVKLNPMLAFKDEVDEVRKLLSLLLSRFQRVYICRGNHEKRWIDMNAGKMDMFELMKLAIPEDLSAKQFGERVKVTMNDHMHVVSGGEKWRILHPRNFRTLNLSVAKDLAAKFQTHQFVAHGHQFAQGYDRSGRLHLLDGGGLFDKRALEYLQETSCYSEPLNGFYLLDDGKITAFEGMD
jgi:hypothetical protein